MSIYYNEEKFSDLLVISGENETEEIESTVNINKTKFNYREYSKNELKELNVLKIVSNIFTNSQRESLFMFSINEKILKYNLFKYFIPIPINIWLFVLASKNIIIPYSIIKKKFKVIFNFKNEIIKKKLKTFTQVLKREKEFFTELNYINFAESDLVYTKKNKLSYYINGYYYLCLKQKDFFINCDKRDYKIIFNYSKLLFKHYWDINKLINIENIYFKIACVLTIVLIENEDEEVFNNCNFNINRNILFEHARLKKLYLGIKKELNADDTLVKMLDYDIV